MLNRNFWKKYFKVYDNLNDIIPYRQLIEVIIEEAAVKEGDCILDAGCGTGNFAKVLLRKVKAKVTGVDNIESALEIYKKKNFGGEVVLSDLNKKLPFESESFDVVVCNNVVYAINPKIRPSLMTEFYRVLKKGGSLIISNPIETARPYKIYFSHFRVKSKEESILAAVFELFVKFFALLRMLYYNFLIHRENNSGNFSFLTEESQENLFTKNGFKVIGSRNVYADQALLTKGVRIEKVINSKG